MNNSSFIYIADTHVGTDKMEYFQQPPYENRLRDLLNALHLWISERGDVDFIIHGGDMVDFCTKDNIKQAMDMFSVFDVPVKLCLGNHDLTTKNSVELWMKYAPCFFENNSPYFALQATLYTLHLVPNNWDEVPLFWGLKQDASIAENEIHSLNINIEANRGTSQALVTHSPIFGRPPEQTGLDTPFHPGTESFRKQITSITDAHDSLKMVLSAHTHMNMNVLHNQTRYITVSSLTEAPFEFKYFRFIGNTWIMETYGLGDYIGFEFDYDVKKTYVQGRAIDRSFEMINE